MKSADSQLVSLQLLTSLDSLVFALILGLPRALVKRRLVYENRYIKNQIPQNCFEILKLRSLCTAYSTTIRQFYWETLLLGFFQFQLPIL